MRSIALVIAEKPSVARDLARVIGARDKRDGYFEGNGFRVGWCVGHLLELAPPEAYDASWKRWSTKTLPMLPEAFQLRPRKGAHAQLAILRRLMRARDVARIVNACDAGREGELIFRWLYEHVFERGGPPVVRLWIASLTEEAIAQGFARLRPAAAYDALAAAARCRSEADWLVGLNATRAMTLLGRRAGGETLYSVGRVQTPTLAMITAREDAIDTFVPEPYWQVDATFAAAAGRYVGRWFLPAADRTPAHDDRLARADLALAIVKDIDQKPGAVAEVTREEQRERAPALFDLTALQKLANQRFGLSANRTLEAAQSLYERHKAITYPRTDARFVTSDVGPTLPDLLQALARASGAAGSSVVPAAAVQAALALGPKPQRKVVDDAEVGDHHAILPTDKVPDPQRLTSDEKNVYTLVARRLVAVFLPESIFDKRTTITRVARHLFRTEGRTRVALGWHAAEPPPPARADAPLLPAVAVGDAVTTIGAEVIAMKTQPPKRFTEATLLGAMEHAGKDLTEEALRRAMRDSGLGTPATRAAIIETLLTRDFIRRDGKALAPTASGRALIAALPPGGQALRSAELTGTWERRLAEMARGADDPVAFMREIRRFTTEVVDAMRDSAPPPAMEVERDVEVLGACPVCGTNVTHGRRAYVCATGRTCSFVIFDKIAGKSIKPNLVKLLLARGRSSVLPGFRSKAGKRFRAALLLSADGTVALDFGRGDATDAPAATKREARPERPKPTRAPPTKPPKDPRPRCPKCGEGRVMAGNRAWGCTRWREGCDLVVAFMHGALRLPDDEADRLMRKGQTRLMPDLDPGGPARLVLDLAAPGHVRVEPRRARGPKP
ncbi:MAG: DNA topoisomerase 3 [Deltaproteobacteria bacterium]|nr:DNA topoisomerase 3 [Deltaproteobacteria bacterium]